MKLSFAYSCAVVGLCSALHFVPSGATPARADPVQWRMNTSLVESRKEIEFFNSFISRVDEASGGELKIQLFTGGSLGIADADLLRALPSGNVFQMATVAPTWLSRDQASFSTILPTGVLGSAGEITKIESALRGILEGTYEKWGIRLIGYTGHPASEGHVYCKTPIRTLDDLRKMKVRVWEKFQIDTLQKLGISAQNIPQSELYLALSTGVVDCTLYAPSWANAISLQEVAPYSSYLFPLVLPPFNMIASKSAWEQLPDGSKAALDTAAAEIWAETSKLWISGALDAQEKEKFTEKGGTVLEPFSAEDQAEFAEAAREAWAEQAEVTGPEAVAGRNRILEALDGS